MMLPNPDWALFRVREILDAQERVWPMATYRPRYSDSPYASMSLTDQALAGTIPGVEPHDATAQQIPHCPVCWDAIRKEPTDPQCPTCYGTGWQGGYHAELGIRLYVTASDFTMLNADSGQQVSVPSVRAMHIARQLLLPGDVVKLNGQTTRYLVGTMVEQMGLAPPMLARAVNLIPLNPYDFLVTTLPLQEMPS